MSNDKLTSQSHSCTNQTGSSRTFKHLHLHSPAALFSWGATTLCFPCNRWCVNPYCVPYIITIPSDNNQTVATFCIKHFNYITMREYTIPSSVCSNIASTRYLCTHAHTHKTKKRNLYNISMHITHLLKMNIFTGLWHRTLLPLHSMSAQTESSPFPSSLTNSQPTRPPLQSLGSCGNKR